MQHFKDPQLRGGWFFYGPYCIKSLESSLLQSTFQSQGVAITSLSTVETNSSFVSTLYAAFYLWIMSAMYMFWSIFMSVWHVSLVSNIAVGQPDEFLTFKRNKTTFPYDLWVLYRAECWQTFSILFSSKYSSLFIVKAEKYLISTNIDFITYLVIWTSFCHTKYFLQGISDAGTGMNFENKKIFWYFRDVV